MSIHPKFPYVAHQELSDRVKRAHQEEFFWGITLIVLTGIAFFFWIRPYYYETSTSNSISLNWIVAFVLYGFFRQLFSLDIPEGTLLEEVESDMLHPYSAQQIHAIAREVCETFYEREIPNIYVVPSSEAIAAVVRVSGLRFVKRWNAIYLSPYLLRALDPNELRAVLSHEMCHVTLYSTFWSRFFYLKILVFTMWITPIFFFFLSLLFGENSLNGFLSFLLFVGLLYGWDFAKKIVAAIIGYWTLRPDQQEIEALCDFQASRRYGKLSMINALLKMGTRQEIFTTLFAQFSPHRHRPTSWLEESTPLEESSPEKSKALEAIESNSIEISEPFDFEVQKKASKLAYLKLNETLPHRFLSVEESWPYIEQAAREGMEQAKAQRFRRSLRKKLNWLKYDTHVVNQKLERVEYETFLQDLKNNPDQPLFFVEEEMDEEKANSAEHPTFRNRILFLEYNHSQAMKTPSTP